MTLENTVDVKIDQSIVIDKNSEFFIAIAKKGVHSFIMLGVMVDGEPKLLAKVGKGNIIDKSFGSSCVQQFTLFGKMVGSHSDAVLLDEGLGGTNNFPEISYQAYAISFDQYLEFLEITRAIHQEQLDFYKNRPNPTGEYKKMTFPERGVYKLREGIHCYIPEEEETLGKITLKYKEIGTFKQQSAQDAKLRQDIIDESKEIHSSNTCRTTARSLLNYTLHYPANVSSLFTIDFNYKTRLWHENTLKSNTFYILPKPPNCFHVPASKRKILDELYKKLEDLPKKEPGSDATRRKFNELKKLYLEVAVEPQLSLNQLLRKIIEHRENNRVLFETRRGHNLLSSIVEMFGFKIKTGTQQTYERIEQTLNKEIMRKKEIEFGIKEVQDEQDKERNICYPSC
ncbi:hypothetical protein [Legionella sp. PC997]|uniref:hypothetical protein n=1 Tax=Legionella sp. PC997 TaxID=2755562 RepID=UPI0015FA2706|nr:hypothetical protein [Legionella sp. PC997]QMT60847.1 protein kinase family protein [Legionella sp. PC997]